MKLIIFLTLFYFGLGLLATYVGHDQAEESLDRILTAIFLAAWCLGDLIKKGRAQ